MNVRKYLVKQADGSFRWQPLGKGGGDGDYVPFRKTAEERRWIAKVEREWRDKKRAKAAAKDAKKRAKLRAKQAQQNSDLAEQNALIARQRLNMSKALNKCDIITIAKSIISAGADAQPGVTSAMLVREIQKRADAAYASQPLSAAQRFSRYTANPEGDGAILLKASRRAVAEAMDSWGDDDDDQQNATANAAYSKLVEIANAKRGPDETLQAAFARVYQSPEYKALVDADKAYGKDVNRMAG